MPLGFDPSLSLNQPIDREFRQSMASGLQQLGKQVSEGIRQIATNRQLRQMGDELKQVKPDSPFFPQEMVGVVTRYPLAVSDPRGTVALNLLGNAHKNWITEKSRTQNRYSAVQNGILNRETGEVLPLPEGAQKQPNNIVVRDKNGAVIANPRTGEEVARFGDPFADEKDPYVPVPSRPGYFYNKNNPQDIIHNENIPSGKAPDVSVQLHRMATERNQLNDDYQRALKESNDALILSNKTTDGQGNEIPFMLQKSIRSKAKTFQDEANKLKSRIDMIDRMAESILAEQQQLGGQLPTPASPPRGVEMNPNQSVNPEALIPTQARPIDKATAAELLKKAGGDRNKARELAKQAGFSF